MRGTIGGERGAHLPLINQVDISQSTTHGQGDTRPKVTILTLEHHQYQTILLGDSCLQILVENGLVSE